MLNKYYTKYDATDPMLERRGWKIYDVDLKFGNGKPLPLCLCWAKETAGRIVNLLNNNDVAFK